MAKKQGTTPDSQQQQEKIFGKFANWEEAAKGYQNAVEEISKRGQQNAQLQAQMQAQGSMLEKQQQLIDKILQGQQNAPVQSAPSLTDDDGDVTPDRLQAYIAWQQAQTQKQLAEIEERNKKVVEESLSNMLKPFQIANSATQNFFGRDDVDDRFNVSTRDAMLSRNPEINKTYQFLVGNEATADQANEYVYRLWKAEAGTTPAVNEEEKMAASGLPEIPGAPMPTDGSGLGEQQDLLAAGLNAAESFEPEAKAAFEKKYFSGTRMEKQIDQLKQYAQTMDPTIKD